MIKILSWSYDDNYREYQDNDNNNTVDYNNYDNHHRKNR